MADIYTNNATGETGDIRRDLDARVYASAPQSIPNATLTTILFDSESYDDAGLHSTATNTGRITIPTGYAGQIRFRGQVAFAANGAGLRVVTVRKNGTTFIGRASIAPSASSDVWAQVVAEDAAVAGDYYELIVLQTSGGALNTGAVDAGSTWFAAEMRLA